MTKKDHDAFEKSTKCWIVHQESVHRDCNLYLTITKNFYFVSEFGKLRFTLFVLRSWIYSFRINIITKIIEKY